MKFKDIAIKDLFTFSDKETHGTGVFRKVSERKFESTINTAYQDATPRLVTSINIEVEPWTAESCARVANVKAVAAEIDKAGMGSVEEAEKHLSAMLDDSSHIPGRIVAPVSRDGIIANSGMKPEKFNPATVIEQMKARSWRNYTVIEYRGENEDPIESKLGALIGNEDFMEIVSWDATGNPIFSGLDETGYGSIRIVLPEGVDEPDYTGMMEAAIPDVYKRRVTLFRAQGFTGMDLYYQLVAAATGSMVRPGSGVNHKPQAHKQKQTNRKNNKARRRSRVYNLKRAA